MATRTIIGNGEVRLAVEEAGNPKGRPILFIHGFSQNRLTWRKQFASELLKEFRLVALDLRGHGDSDKPRDRYGDSRVWAEDIQAIIDGLGLERPILSGWSYGGAIVADYLRVYGEARLGGIHLIGAFTKLGEPLLPLLGKEFVGLVPGFFSNDASASASALHKLVRLITRESLPPEEFYYTLGYNTIVPPYVREGLLSRSLTSEDVLARIQVPVLITHGADDEIVLLDAAREHEALIPDARVSIYPNVGHAPFWEDRDRFDRELYNFGKDLS